MKRPSLLNRKYALGILQRKASLAAGSQPLKEEVVRDNQGFEDIENYFSPPASQPSSNAHAGKSEWTVTRTPSKSAAATASRSEHIELAHPGDDHDYQQNFNDDYEVPVAEESEAEISFGSKVLPSPTSVSETATMAASKKSRGRPRKSRQLLPAATFFEESEQNGDDEESRRTSKRKRFEPLQYWRNERVVYGRRQSAGTSKFNDRVNVLVVGMPVIVDILKAPKTPKPLEKRRKRRSSAAAALRRAFRGPEAGGYTVEPQAGLKVSGKVRAAGTTDSSAEYETLLAVSADHIKGEKVPGADFRIHTVFAEEDFMSAGVLQFPKPGDSKPSRNSSKHALAFHVVQGSFEVAINRTSFVAGPGACFFVPRNNQYAIKHVGTKGSGRLFFCHCRQQ